MTAVRTRVRLVLGTLLVGAALASGCSLPGEVTGPVELTATFTDVGDLVSGHSVQVADVRVGSVTKIVLTKGYEAKVTMHVKDGLELPADSVAILRTTSLLGEKFIEIRKPDKAATGAAAGRFLADGSTIKSTREAPELEFVAEEAVNVLGAVAANDLATIVQTGGVGFAGRAVELGQLIDSLSTVTGTLAGQTNDIVAIIDGLDKATSTLAGSDQQVDALLVNLSKTTQVLSNTRELTLQTLRDITRLAKAQNDEVFTPYRAKVEQQVRQLDAVLDLVAQRREEVGVLVDWLAQFVQKTPLGVPGDFAQIYAWLQVAPLETGP
jgi:phospholipid/cholesterol/gamma-HCH transport system substrate-binding protein